MGEPILGQQGTSIGDQIFFSEEFFGVKIDQVAAACTAEYTERIQMASRRIRISGCCQRPRGYCYTQPFQSGKLTKGPPYVRSVLITRSLVERINCHYHDIAQVLRR